MKATFVHDHKFPKNGLTYFYSYGFDKEFFERYLNIFDEFEIIARERELSNKETTKSQTVNSSVGFLTIKGYKYLKSSVVRRKIYEKVDKSDCLIIRLPSILGLYVINIAKKMNKPYLIELVGCPWDAFWNSNMSKKIVAPVITALTRRAVHDAKYVVYVTEEFLQKRYPTIGESISCSNVTLHSVDELSLLNRIEKINELKLNKKKILGTCATVDALYKGQQYVIQAISKLKSEGYNVEYQLVGGGDPSFLKSLAEKFGVEREVKFLGEMKHEDVFDWLEEIDIYIQPSETDGLPRAVIEAMSKGCPVIGSNAGGIPELIDKEFVFSKRNVDSLCEVYKKFTPEIMKEQAIANHKSSKKYLKSILYKRREDFFRKFIDREIG